MWAPRIKLRLAGLAARPLPTEPPQWATVVLNLISTKLSFLFFVLTSMFFYEPTHTVLTDMYTVRCCLFSHQFSICSTFPPGVHYAELSHNWGLIWSETHNQLQQQSFFFQDFYRPILPTVFMNATESWAGIEMGCPNFRPSKENFVHTAVILPLRNKQFRCTCHFRGSERNGTWWPRSLGKRKAQMP